MKWSAADCPEGLSVNSEHNLLVMSGGERKLQIFTTHGTLLQDIQLHSHTSSPSYAIQLSTGQFLVSQGPFSLLQCVSLVGVDGAVVRSYGGQAGSKLMQMNQPRGLAADREGRVLVADWGNNRLLVIDKSLSRAHVMSVRIDRRVTCPYSLSYEQSRRRLYIGAREGGQVIVIDNLKDFSALSI